MANRKTPHHLKVVKGNPGRRPLGKAPAKAKGTVAMPPLLVRGEFPGAQRARELWDELIPVLTAHNLVNAATAYEFGNWCHMQAAHEHNPGETTAAMISQRRSLGSSFGLDAISWERLTAGKDDGDDEDPAAAYFG